jgi:beta-glucosidase
MAIQFPKDFLWGAATAAYQVEGNNDRSDWWHWEKEAGKENSGDACRHYDLYELDLELAKGLGHNAHRLSVEWSRVEPEEGKFSEAALKHYVDVILALRARKIEPVVTLHHFTNPVWLVDIGGWTNKRAVHYFLRYAERVVRALAPHVRYWITINEPTIYFTHAFMLGVWPPQEKSIWKMLAVKNHLAAAHIKAYRMIHKIYQEPIRLSTFNCHCEEPRRGDAAISPYKSGIASPSSRLAMTRPCYQDRLQSASLPKPRVSIAQHMQAFVPCVPSMKNRFAAFLRHKWFNLGLIDQFVRHKALDFIGLNYYSRQLVELKRWGLRNLFEDICESGHHPVKKNSLGWAIYPEGLCDLLVGLKKYDLPVMITENGICTPDDALRWEFIQGHLESIHRAMEQGVPVTGYLYWSLLDNFEWDKGFGPRFGLIDIDYKTQLRTVRESAKRFGEVCKTGVLQ